LYLVYYVREFGMCVCVCVVQCVPCLCIHPPPPPLPSGPRDHNGMCACAVHACVCPVLSRHVSIHMIIGCAAAITNRIQALSRRGTKIFCSVRGPLGVGVLSFEFSPHSLILYLSLPLHRLYSLSFFCFLFAWGFVGVCY